MSRTATIGMTRWIYLCTVVVGWATMSVAQLGTVKAHQKISATDGGFVGVLDGNDRFGSSVATLGDLDGDGVADLAVGAWQDDDGGGNEGAVWVLFLNADGTVKAHQKISDTQGGFTGFLRPEDFFGASIASLGDLDGDGVTDLAVGADGDDDGGTGLGAVWVLFLNADGTVKAHQKISRVEGGFTGDLDVDDFFGASVASLGDFDGDGVADLAVGASQDDDGGLNQGAVWLLFLNDDGTVKAHQKISSTEGTFTGGLSVDDRFGTSMASLGDLNGDGVTDLAVGAKYDDDGGGNRGAVWFLFLNAAGTVSSHQKISSTEGAFTGALDNERFGTSISPLGDLDGDGVTEIAVGNGDNRGAVWVLFLNADGTVKAHQKISDTEGGFTGLIDGNDEFGTSLASLGDLNGDGVADLAVGARGDDDGVGQSGAVWVLFLLEPTFDIILEGPNADCVSNPPFDCTTLTAGFANGATDGLDGELGEVRLPPLPPTTDIFDVRFLAPSADGLRLDLRDPDVGSPVWRIALQAGLGGYPVTLTWDVLTLPPGDWRLRNLDGTQGIDINMTIDASLVVTDSLVTGLTITTGGARTITINYPSGWSMASIPVMPADNSLGVLFPDALSAFQFSGGYQQVATLNPCTGYWLNLTNGGDYTITGDATVQCSALLPVGWSMLGVPLSGTRVENIIQDPVDLLLSVFAFEGAYVQKAGPNRLAEGQGFWIDMAGAGQVTLNSDPAGSARAVPVAQEMFAGPVLWAQSGEKRQEIHLGVESDQVNTLPPLPPAGVLDMRVRVGDISTWLVPLVNESTDYELAVQGLDVALGWSIPASAVGRWELAIGEKTVSLSGQGALDRDDLTTASGRLRLRQVDALPLDFRLQHNYPNPFNPATTIRYELKVTSPVSLMVYDITGQLVRSLVAAEQPAGRYSISWDGLSAAGVQVASGVYLYELRAGSFRSTRKMLLMK
jgi:hypothetical protein